VPQDGVNDNMKDGQYQGYQLVIIHERVLQEAADPTVPLRERIRFLGIFRIIWMNFPGACGTLNRMIEFSGKKVNMHMEIAPKRYWNRSVIVLQQQNNSMKYGKPSAKSWKKKRYFC